MKKTLLTSAALALAAAALAGPVDKDAARAAAGKFLAAKGRALSASKTPFRAPRQGAASVEQAYYYVFNADGGQGYVIVSGDDRTEPVLGYVERGSFDAQDIPENMRSWLQLYADQIRAMDERGVRVDRTALKARGQQRPTRHSVPQLMTSTWNQGHPYNLTCPKYYKGDGTLDYPASGCTATAMAQVVNYYKYPPKLKTAIPAISNTYTLDDGTKKTVTAKVIPRGSVIDWEHMLDSYDCDADHEHDASDTAVANLMLYCGQAVHMGYGASSGANFDAETYIKYFGFDDSAFVGERSDYTAAGWLDALYGEISTGHPVLFSGFSSGGGHAFVLDGFDGESLFHVNWGWGGGSNGWFLVEVLNPGDTSGIGASSTYDGYSMWQRALLGLKLPDKKKDDPKPVHATIHDITANGTTISAKFINWTGQTNSFSFGIVRADDSGVALVGTSQSQTDLGVNGVTTKTFNIRRKLQPGVHRLSPASKLMSGKTWVPELNLRNDYIEAVVDSDLNITLSRHEPVEDIVIDTIVFPGSLAAHEGQEVRVTFRNRADEYYHTINLFTGKDGEMKDSEYRSALGVGPKGKTTVSFLFFPDEAGTYDLYFCREGDTTQVVAKAQVDITETPMREKAHLGVSSMSLTNAVSGIAYGDRIEGKATIKNLGSAPFSGGVRLQCWRQPGGSGSAWGGSSVTAQISAAPGKSDVAEFAFDNLTPGDKYFVQAAYTTQGGELDKGSVWDHGWPLNQGSLAWKNNGTIVGAAAKTLYSASSLHCACYLNGLKVNRILPNKNPNTIYCVRNTPAVPTGLAGRNLVLDGRADTIRLVPGSPYYLPMTFTAGAARFAYPFAPDTDGTRWQALTLPFTADSVYLDGRAVSLGDTLNHFHIYEFAYLGEGNEVLFAPATSLRANTPYIISGDGEMAGDTLLFTATDAAFYRSGTDKMLVCSDAYQFYGTTYTRSLKNVYALNEEGTAFTWRAVSTALDPLTAYFTTTLPEEERAEELPLPAVPAARGTGIAGVPGTAATGGSAVYSVTGQKVGTTLRGLKPGLYVTGGRKVLVR